MKFFAEPPKLVVEKDERPTSNIERPGKRDSFRKVKKDEDFNHRNTLKYFEDYNPNLTPKLRKIAIYGWALSKWFMFVMSRISIDYRILCKLLY